MIITRLNRDSTAIAQGILPDLFKLPAFVDQVTQGNGFMADTPVPAPSRAVMDCAALVRAARDAGTRFVATALPAFAQEIPGAAGLEADVDVDLFATENAALTAAIQAAHSGARAMCVMASTGLTATTDLLLASAATVLPGGLVIVVLDDLDDASRHNQPDVRRWGRLAQMPVLEPVDLPEASAMIRPAFELSEEFAVAVLMRGLPHAPPGNRGIVPAHASPSSPFMLARQRELVNFADQTPLNVLERGKGDKVSRRVGFITAGPTYRDIRTAFPDASVLRMGLSYPLPMNKIRGLVEICQHVVVIEDGEPLAEFEIRAEGFKVCGKDFLSRCD